MPSPRILWKYEIKAFNTTPSVGFDGTVYLSPNGPKEDPHIYAISKTGHLVWKYCYDPEVRTPNRSFGCRASISVGAYGKLIASCYLESEKADPRYLGNSTKLLKLSLTGEREWEASFKGYDRLLAQAEAADGTILFCSPGKKLCAFEPAGNRKWECKLGRKLFTSPRVGPDGTIYVGASDKKIYAIDPNGSIKWDFVVGGLELREFSLGAGGNVCINTYEGEIIVLNPQGQVLLRGINLPGEWGAIGTPLVRPNGALMARSRDAIHSIAPDGKIEWSYPFGRESHYSAPALSSDGIVLLVVRPDNLGDPRRDVTLLGIGPTGQREWEMPLEGWATQGVTLTQDGLLYLPTSKFLYALQCPSGLADSPWPMDAQNPQRTGRANPKFNQPVEYGAKGSAADLPVEIRSATPARPLPDKPFTREEILQQLDADADFPMLDNGYLYLATARLSAYRDAVRWAIVMEIVGWNNHAAGSEGVENALYCYGNWLNQKPGLTEDGFLHMARDGDESTTFDGEYVDSEAKTLYVRDNKIRIPRGKRHYAALGIEQQEPDMLMSHELLRALVAEHRDLFLATEEELSQRVPVDLPLVLRLDEWHHPDMSADEKPSHTKTFQMLADVLVTGDPARYQPMEPPNTHWKHWPTGGAL